MYTDRRRAYLISKLIAKFVMTSVYIFNDIFFFNDR